eukprot:Hpha_TRINITY_DN13449_c0_g1::TRINITY_DN13449_c0_g1_i1::g.131033::m.131033
MAQQFTLLPMFLSGNARRGHPLFGTATSVPQLTQALEYFFQLQHLRRLREAIGERMDQLQQLTGEDQRERWVELDSNGLEEVLMRRAIEASLQEPQPCGPPPASEEDIANLQTVRLTFLDLAQVDATKECMVCLDKFQKGTMVTKLPCKHAFCPDCIKEWLQRHGTCPICRSEVNNVPELRAGRPRVLDAMQTEADSDRSCPLRSPQGRTSRGLVSRIRGAAAEAASAPSSDSSSSSSVSSATTSELTPSDSEPAPQQVPVPRGLAGAPVAARRGLARAAAAPAVEDTEPQPPLQPRRKRPAPRTGSAADAEESASSRWGRRPSGAAAAAAPAQPSRHRARPGQAAAAAQEGERVHAAGAGRNSAGRVRGSEATSWGRGTTAGLGRAQ